MATMASAYNPFVTQQQQQQLAQASGAQPQSPPPPDTRVTGGNAPALPVNKPQIKPNQIDPNTGQLINTGTAVTGGNAPASIADMANQITQGQPVYSPSMAPAQVISDITNQLLDPSGQYIQNARLRGIEQAASRGLRNSSISAGQSQRAAMEAVQPLVNEASSIFNRREQNAFDAEQTIRQQIFTSLENQRDRDQQITMGQVQNWLNDQTFQREFNAQLSLLPITSAANLSQMLVQYAMDKPEVWTPDVVDGVSNFFNQSFFNILQQYFPQYYGGNNA